MARIIGYNDGFLGVPRRIGPRQFEWPFAGLGDYDTVIIHETWKAAAGVYRPMTRVSVHPLWKAYLMEETPPAPSDFGTEKWVRTFAMLPAPQVSYPGSRYIQKPDYAAVAVVNPYGASGGGVTKGPVTIFSPYQVLGMAWYTSGASGGIYTDGDSKLYTSVKVPSSQAIGYATAGTFTLTYGASTTGALNYNASAATIAAAINALASVVAEGLTVGVSMFLNITAYGSLVVTYSHAAGHPPASTITMDATSLTVSTSKHPVTLVAPPGTSISVQTVLLPTHQASTAHGLSASVALAAVWGSSGFAAVAPHTLVHPVSYWGVIDADTIWLPNINNGVETVSLIGTYDFTYSAPGGGTAYAGGQRLTRTRITTTFYLPGVSVGIATPGDIPVQAGLGNSADFLAALLTPLSGFQVYESAGPKPWKDGWSIYQVETTEIDFDELF